MKNKIFLLMFIAVIASCSQQKTEQANDDASKNMNRIFDNYYEDRLKLFPLEATAIADNRYNDQLPCDISDSYRAKLKSFYKKYLDEISNVKRDELIGEDALSHDVFKRE